MPPDSQYADQLQGMLEQGGRDTWPLRQERGVLARLTEWQAFSETNPTLLKALCKWDRSDHRDRTYVPDPLPERIKDAFADLQFGGETDFVAPTITEPGPTGEDRQKPGPDQENLEDLADENDLQSALQDAAGRCVAEGEVWWRIYTDRDAFEHPVIEWHSRLDVIPLYRGRKLLAAAFVSDLSTIAQDAPVIRAGDSDDPAGSAWWLEQDSATSQDPVVFRYVEIQTGGMTRNLLYKGERGKLGDPQPLSAHPQTADLRDEWVHDLEVQTRGGKSVPLMLAGRVTNGGTTSRLGRSQYAGVKWLLYELNKVSSVGARNVDLTMHKRAVVNMDLAQPDTATFDDEGAARGRAKVKLPDTFIASSDEMGENNQMRILEFSDAWADALLAWDGGLTDKILTRCRVAPQLVGRHTEDAATGPALRARLMDSILAATGKARAWDDQLPKILRAAQKVDALSEEAGGCGHQWSDPDGLPEIKRDSVLPEDPTDEITRLVAAVGGEIMARRTAIQDLNPDWDDDRVDRELELIGADQPAATLPGTIRVPRPPVNLPNGNGGLGAPPPPEQVPQ